jgi:hypothetical protein
MNSSAPQVYDAEHETNLVESVVVNGTVQDSFRINRYAAPNLPNEELNVKLALVLPDDKTNSAAMLVRAKSSEALTVAVQQINDISEINSDPESLKTQPVTF